MGREHSSVDWENDIYRKGKQLNIWPFSEVVSVFHREMSDWSEVRAPRVLEVGCGAGNNLWALSRRGYDSYGVDISSTAIQIANQRLIGLGLDVELSVSSMKTLPFAEGFFDYVLDRASICQVSMDEIPECVEEIRRVLRKSGKLFSFGLPGEDHSGRTLGELQRNGSYDNFTGGVFASVGLTSFFNSATISSLFSFFSTLEITRKREEGALGDIAEEYSIVAHV